MTVQGPIPWVSTGQYPLWLISSRKGTWYKKVQALPALLPASACRLDEVTMSILVGDDAMPAVGGEWEWVADAPYPFWRHLGEHESAVKTLRAAGMLPEVSMEELPA